MIARPAQFAGSADTLLDEIQRETRDRFALALYVVNTTEDVDALEAVNIEAVIATQPAALEDYAREVTETGAPVVIVNAADSALRDMLAERLPAAELREVGLPPGAESVAGLLAYSPRIRTKPWSTKTATAKRETWLAWVAERSLLSIPVGEPRADGDGRMEFPLSALPPACRAIVEHGARAQGVDPAFWAVPLIGIIAGCVGNSRRAMVKPGWFEPAVLWTGLVAPSGVGKSPPLRELLRPVRKLDYELHEQTERAQQQFTEQLDEWKGQKGEKGERPEPPPMLAHIIDDATMEAIAVRLLDNRRGLLLANDELAGFLRSFDKYRKGGGDEQKWLQIHNGDGIKVDRKSAPGGNPARVLVRRAAVSIVGTIQPAVAAKYLGAEEQRASGLSARMLVAGPPIVAAKWTDETVPQHVTDAWSRVVGSLLDLSCDDGEDGPLSLRLEPGARAAFIAFHDANGQACFHEATNGDEDLAAALAKLRGAAPRLALVLALARATEIGQAETLASIGEDSMVAGIALARWFEGEARRLYAEWAMAEVDAVTTTDKLASIKDRIFETVLLEPRTLTELHKELGNHVPAGDMDAALQKLIDEGNIAKEAIPTAGRPRTVIRITANPPRLS